MLLKAPVGWSGKFRAAVWEVSRADLFRAAHAERIDHRAQVQFVALSDLSLVFSLGDSVSLLTVRERARARPQRR
jgi:hypothetical protein